MQKAKSLSDSATFAAEFKALAEKDIPDIDPNLWNGHERLEFYGVCTESGIGNWSPLGGRSELFLAEFIDVATRAGIALGAPTSVNPCDYFLDCLYNEHIERRTRLVLAVRGPEFGRISRACEAATAFWLWHTTKTDAKKHGFAKPSGNVFESGPDVHVTWGPYWSGYGVLLFRNEGTEEARNIRLCCSPDIGWTPILSPQVIASIPAGGHFRSIDITKYAKEGEDGWATTDGQSIAEFVHSRATEPLKMMVMFENELGVEQTRDLRVSSAGWMGYQNVRIHMERATITKATPKLEANESAVAESRVEHDSAQPLLPGRGSDATDFDFTSEAGRNQAIAAYIQHWTSEMALRGKAYSADRPPRTCSEASLARAARVHPGDLIKWRKGGLPGGSMKGTRIEDAIRSNAPPVPPKPSKKS